VRDLVARVTTNDTAGLELVRRLAETSMHRGLDSAFYWKASKQTRYDSGYDLREKKIRRTISWLTEHGVESGIHPGYDTYQSRSALQTEVLRIREVLPNQAIGGRQHYLRWSPATWLDWEACGLSYDSTVGFADALGFRAGTCVPYKPWLFSENRVAALLEIPLIAMDCTPIMYMGLTLEQSLSAIQECIAACSLVGGVFTLLWHNMTLIEPDYGDLYERILESVGKPDKFDWMGAIRRYW
jgi:hypothetical protein